MVGAEEEEVAKMGCPSLGEHTQVEVVIEESYEFKVSVFLYLTRSRTNQQPVRSIISPVEIMITSKLKRRVK